MAGSRLLDTNAVIALLAEDAAPRRATNGLELLIPAPAVGELYYGAYKSIQIATNLSNVNRFVTGRNILACDAATAQHYGLIRQTLRAKGRPIPDNDIWIAAIAIQYQLILVTRDQHFNQVDRLQVEKW